MLAVPWRHLSVLQVHLTFGNGSTFLESREEALLLTRELRGKEN